VVLGSEVWCRYPVGDDADFKGMGG
jgi:hypothetical protein